jgi:metal-dependent amidase/aminoacylase/carboxypeptidase family protein
MSTLLEKIKQLSAELTPETLANRHHIHANPELSYQEFQTQAYVLQQLEQMGIQAKKIATTGLIAEIKGKNPDKKVVALRADMDALPILETNDVPYKSKTQVSCTPVVTMCTPPPF